MKSKRRRPLLLASCIIVILVCTISYRNLASWLVVSDPLPKSLDAIFTFAGESHRIVYSKELFLRYPASTWILSYPTKKILVPLSKGRADTSRIVVVDSCKNTNSEVLFLSGWVKSTVMKGSTFSPQRPLAIGLVSTPFHMARIRMDLSRKFKTKACTYYFLPVPYERYGLTKSDYKKWWSMKSMRSAIYLEFEKFIYYFFRYWG
jgi:uncharacterized SAM-binding protein YcdF (DUF218 family)